MSPVSYRRFGVAGTILLAVSLAACGGTAAPASTSSPATTSAKPSAAASAPQSSAAVSASAKPSTTSAAASTAATGPVKIGLETSTSGVYALLGESMNNGFKMFMDEVGSKAGGRTIQVVNEDEASDPKIGLDKAKKLVEQDKVDILTGIVPTPTLYAIRDYLETSPRKIMMVASNAGGSDMDTSKKSPYVVRVSFSNYQDSISMGAYAFNTLGVKKVFISAPDYAAGHERVDPFKKAFTAAGGQVVGEVYPPLGNSDFAPFLSKFVPSGADASFNFYAGSDAIRFIQQYSQFGVGQKLKLLGLGDMVDDTVLGQEGQAPVGAITELHYYSTIDNPENKKFVADYKAKFGKDANAFAVQSYDAARLIVDALNQTNGSPAPAALLKAMQGHKWDSPRGPVSISPDFNDIVQNVYLAETKVVDGKVTNVITHTFESVKPA